MKKSIVLVVMLSSFFTSCVEDINLEITGGVSKIVVEGKIESGKPAEVFIMRSNPISSTRDYFEFVYVFDATVTITDGTTTETLVSTLDPIPPHTFTRPDPESTYYLPYKGSTIIGTPGKTYTITIKAKPNPDSNEEKTYTATTTIPYPVVLDSVWWEPTENLDSLGFAWAHISEPAGLVNSYKWFAKRSNPYYEQGEVADRRYVSPYGSTFDDKFIDGKSLDIYFNRGIDASDSLTQAQLQSTENNDLFYYYKNTDTVFIKFTTIDRPTTQFYTTYEAALQSNGNPFASPVSIISNVEGDGLGIFAGFGVSYDTIYPQP